MRLAADFLHHILNTPSVQAEMQARLEMGHDLETVVISTAQQLGYAVTFADITAVLDINPALADKIAMLLPAPMLELDEAQLMMIAGGGARHPTWEEVQEQYRKEFEVINGRQP